MSTMRRGGLNPLLLPRDEQAFTNGLHHLDYAELQRKKVLLDEELRALRCRISKADNDKHHQGVFADREWYAHAQRRKAILTRHVQLIQAEQGIRREELKLARVQLHTAKHELRYKAMRHVLHALFTPEQVALIDRMTDARQRELEELGDQAPRLVCADRSALALFKEGAE